MGSATFDGSVTHNLPATFRCMSCQRQRCVVIGQCYGNCINVCALSDVAVGSTCAFTPCVISLNVALGEENVIGDSGHFQRASVCDVPERRICSINGPRIQRLRTKLRLRLRSSHVSRTTHPRLHLRLRGSPPGVRTVTTARRVSATTRAWSLRVRTRDAASTRRRPPSRASANSRTSGRRASSSTRAPQVSEADEARRLLSRVKAVSRH